VGGHVMSCHVIHIKDFFTDEDYRIDAFKAI
jgi:hypothetical protein